MRVGFIASAPFVLELFCQADYPNTTFLPAAIKLNQIVFDTRYDLELTGNIWVYMSPQAQALSFKPQPTFPYATSLPTVNELASYNTTKFSGNSTMCHLYEFSTTIRNVFDFQPYPFDANIIEIHFTPQLSFSMTDQYQRVSYTPAWGDWQNLPGTNLFLLSAVARQLVGYRAEKCEWAYELADEYTSDGSEAFRESYATLKLNVYVHRNTFSASIVNFVYLAVVSLFMYLFISVLSGSRALSKKWTKHQYSLPMFVGALVALIFAIISSQQTLRVQFPNSTTLLDFMYIFIYFFVVLIAFMGFLYFKGESFLASRLFLPIKVIYWPLVTTIMLGITLGIYIQRMLSQQT